jgi:HD-like signal output (HDOD) protein
MAIPKPLTRRPRPDELRHPVLLRALPERTLTLLTQGSELLRLPMGSRLVQSTDRPTHLMFLLEGRMLVQDPLMEDEQVEGGTSRSHFPLIAESSPAGECLCRSDCRVLRIPIKLLDRIQLLAASEARAEAELRGEEARAEERILLDCHQAMKQGRLELPNLPEVGLRIARHIDSPLSTVDSITHLIETDPPLAARLRKATTSSAFGARDRGEKLRDAIGRLGRAVTRDLVTCLVLKEVFRSRSPLIKARLGELWRHSTRVAVLTHALARRYPGFEPARALLIGLVHDIGVIPILAAARRYQGLVENEAALRRVEERLRAECGLLTLRSWGLATELEEAAREAEDWFRNKRPQVDYIDLLIVAQLHGYAGTSRMPELPHIDEVPAFRKLRLGGLSPRLSLRTLDEAEQEIERVRQLIA